MGQRREPEPFIEIPSLGVPNAEERSWRSRALVMRSAERRVASIRAMTLDDWGRHLTSTNPWWGLRAVRYLRHIVDGHEERLIRLARERCYTWEEIAHLLGFSRQSVHRRWSERIGDRPGWPRRERRPPSRVRSD
ncbi:MAG TPA: hypothetical protein VGB52_03835 [Actinomycetota bacterium]